MKPVYLDLHIHTSDDPNSLNENYDLDTLVTKVKEKSQGDDFLISLTDHNTINEKVYLEAIEKIPRNIILGVELHIQTHKDTETNAYHCHIYFNFDETEITEECIKDINTKLDALYPNKAPALKDENIPLIEQILEAFDEYDFILLSHGGQTHATFDQALPDGKEFDNAMQRSIYYNFFDGFTSRSDKKTEKTKEYLARLGVQEFVNLITCTDNYNPAIYPQPKNEETYKFIPTWMFASPTFSGLRMSLSDSSRLEYSQEKPKKWRESIKNIRLKNDKIDIDIQLTPGLNVIIGESSSGKTLLVDSLYRKITKTSFEDSDYNEYSVENIQITYPDNLHPHFIRQNFIASVTGDDKKVNDIEIIAKIIPENSEATKKISKGLKDLNEHLDSLFNTVERIEELEAEIKRVPVLSELTVTEDVEENILKRFSTVVNSAEHEEYSEYDKANDLEFLDSLDVKLEKNPFIKHNKKLISALKEEIIEMRSYSALEDDVKRIIKDKKSGIDRDLEEKEGESQRKRQDFDSLIEKLKEYYGLLLQFEKTLGQISEYSIEAESEKVQVKEYTLSVENKFELNKEILTEEFNNLLLRDKSIINFDDISPENLFKGNFRNNQKGTQKGSSATYKSIKENVYTKFFENNKVSYKIKTQDGKDFDNLSPGLKTSIILDLVLNFEEDRAPLIIDQPEDNLATSYMNDGLVKSIKGMKQKKQIIFVSHNATIPMSGDAQNIILCENNNGKIEVRSNPLEGKVNDINVVDHIARIADGGKPSIKKRFKKYNLKKFKE
jgi:ABC-type dipeptide/oligopeptide/nickel transport system ATPase component